MQEEQQILQQIERAQTVLEELSRDNVHKHQQQTKICAEVDALEQQLASFIIPEPNNHTPIQQEIQQLTDLIANLSQDLLTQTNAAHTAHTNRETEIAQLHAHNAALISKNRQTVVVDKKQLEAIHAQTQELKAKAQSQTAALEKTNHELHEKDQVLISTQAQIEEIKHSQQQLERSLQSIQKEEAQYESLLKQLLSLEKEYQHSSQEVAEERQKKQSGKKQLKASIQGETNELVQLNKIHQAEIQVSKSLHSQLVDLDKNSQLRQAEKDKAVSVLEKQAGERQKQVQSLRRVNSGKSEEVRREEERIGQQRRKMQRAKNYKELIRQAFAENESLLKQKENELSVYNKTLLNKSTYATRQTLDILQRELNRHQLQKNISVEGKAKELERLQKTSKHLKDKIKSLTRLTQQSLAKEQKHLNELNKKRDGLLVEKLNTDKLITERTNKLNQYIKQFPNHEQDKEQKKRLKIKKTESITTEQPTEPPQSRKKSRKERRKKGEQEEVQEVVVEESEGFKGTGWYKRRASGEYDLPQEKPIYMNPYMQAAGVLLVLLVVTVANLD